MGRRINASIGDGYRRVYFRSVRTGPSRKMRHCDRELLFFPPKADSVVSVATCQGCGRTFTIQRTNWEGCEEHRPPLTEQEKGAHIDLYAL